MKYTSAAAFRQALEQRLKNEATSTGLGLARLRKQSRSSCSCAAC
ncbi:MAG: hypothetical protein WB709_07400 [Solirubrobacteraceae bacterium]